MPKSRKRTQRQRGAPDPVAQRISSDLGAHRVDPEHASENEAHDGATAAGSPRYSVNPADVDLSAGAEFVQAQPNDDVAEK